ncbi:hypothetical protein ABZT17_37735 [Streptomyces sp. NPDC005648]|uniref:hypothetical protein n=1 Tax=Streptomyces sp. NPDC005648 TaxID=3157044 RepID=UPI00339E3AD5
MSELGELDHPGTPGGAGAWDERSREWLTQDPGGTATTEPVASRPTTPRRAAADPVKALMHRHRDLCERAVDPLEIAAGLEAHGITDRTAARFRHRDVFSLAEEMHARATHTDEPQAPTATPAPRVRADWILLTLLPGALCTATVTGLHLTQGQPRLAVAAAGALAVALSTPAALSRGPLSRATTRTPAPLAPHLCTYWLLAYALLGDGLLATALTGGPEGPPVLTALTTSPPAPHPSWLLTTALLPALAWSCAPAAWSAHLLTTRARRRLPTSRGLEDFAAAVRPLLLGAFALYLCALTALVTLSTTVLAEPAPYAEAIPLGALLLLSRLLTTHGSRHAPAIALTAAAATEAAALATTFASRLPGCGFLATPVRTLVDAAGPPAVPALACAAVAVPLLWHATRTLARASAHAPKEQRC